MFRKDPVPPEIIRKIVAFTRGFLHQSMVDQDRWGDYITFDGIDLAENPSNNNITKMMEWGYALVKKQNTAPLMDAICGQQELYNNTPTKSITVRWVYTPVTTLPPTPLPSP
ncbi:MAG: hypothetical protein IPH45_19000 [Bacteroidales bacterium]|nr:hypothetical protein [Bacteroidales bacterium]